MKDQHIFMTGGTGFFGKSILSMLQRGFLPGNHWVILSRDPDRFLRENPQFQTLRNVRFIAGDVTDFVFPKEQFDVIVHAATPAVTTLSPGQMRDVIVNGTRHLLAFAGSCGARRFLLTSSGAVYGIQPPELGNIPETFPCNPVTEYGIAKLDAEKMCLDSGVDTVIARCFAFIGPYLNLDIHYAAGNFIRNGLGGEPIIIKGDGTPYRSYLYADDLVEWLFALLERGNPGEICNIGSPDEISIAGLARCVAGCFDPVPPVRILTEPSPGVPAARYVPDVSRAQNRLGLRVKVPLIQALRKTIDAHVSR